MNKSLFILLSSLFVSNIFAGNKDELHYPAIRPAVFAAARLGQVNVSHNGKDCSVIKDGKAHPVKPYLVDKTLRGRSTEQVARYLAHHAIEIKENNDHEFSLEAHNRQLGGGPGGAYWGMVIGKGLGYGIGVGICYTAGGLVTIVAGPIAGAVVAESMKVAALPMIETFSNTMAVAGAIAGGVATGPV